jgi:hypothetical protein
MHAWSDIRDVMQPSIVISSSCIAGDVGEQYIAYSPIRPLLVLGAPRSVPTDSWDDAPSMDLFPPGSKEAIMLTRSHIDLVTN